MVVTCKICQKSTIPFVNLLEHSKICVQIYRLRDQLKGLNQKIIEECEKAKGYKIGYDTLYSQKKDSIKEPSLHSSNKRLSNHDIKNSKSLSPEINSASKAKVKSQFSKDFDFQLRHRASNDSSVPRDSKSVNIDISTATVEVIARRKSIAPRTSFELQVHKQSEEIPGEPQSMQLIKSPVPEPAESIEAHKQTDMNQDDGDKAENNIRRLSVIKKINTIPEIAESLLSETDHKGEPQMSSFGQSEIKRSNHTSEGGENGLFEHIALSLQKLTPDLRHHSNPGQMNDDIAYVLSLKKVPSLEYDSIPIPSKEKAEQISSSVSGREEPQAPSVEPPKIQIELANSQDGIESVRARVNTPTASKHSENTRKSHFAKFALDNQKQKLTVFNNSRNERKASFVAAQLNEDSDGSNSIGSIDRDLRSPTSKQANDIQNDLDRIKASRRFFFKVVTYGELLKKQRFSYEHSKLDSNFRQELEQYAGGSGTPLNDKTREAAEKLKTMVEKREELLDKIRKLEVTDIRKHHTLEGRAQFLAQAKYNQSLREIQKEPKQAIIKMIKRISSKDNNESSFTSTDETSSEMRALELEILTTPIRDMCEDHYLSNSPYKDIKKIINQANKKKFFITSSSKLATVEKLPEF